MIHSYRNQFLHALAFTFAIAFVGGCSDDDDNPTGGGPTDTTPPSVSSVSAVDENHIDVAFNETVQRESAEDVDNYVIIQTTVAFMAGGSPGDTLAVLGAALGSDQKTVSLSTGTMLVATYDMSVTGVKDASGNAIVTPVVTSFTGSSDNDVTAPELVYRSPAPNATGVAVGTQILLTFSEPVTYSSFISGFTLSADAVEVPYDALSYDNGVHVVVTPNSLLELGTVYTIALTGIDDGWGNIMADVNWTFTTTNTADTTPPSIVSSFPANGALNVDVDTYLSLTFSEPIDQPSLGPIMFPDPGDGDIVWSNGGKTITFTPYLPLYDDQTYTVTTIPGSYSDLSGNLNTQFMEIRFSTGSAFAAGSFAGTISGDPTSDYADDPTGARVLATVGFGLEDFVVAGSALVASNDTYDIRNLSDADYIPLSVMDTNGDGIFDPSLGDAIGAYGVDFDIFDLEPDSVTISGGNRVTGVDFQLWDFSAITGTVSYSGLAKGSHFVGVGLFATTGFDPSNEPDYTTEAQWPDFPEWGFINLEYSIPDGSYYVGAFLDANDTGSYEPGSDPAGFYGGLPTPTAITIQNGSDRNDVVIPMADPPVVRATGSVAWREPTKRAMPVWFGQIAKAIAEGEGRREGFIGANARRNPGGAVAAPEVISTRTGWSR